MSISSIDVSDFITVEKLIETLTRLRDNYHCGNLPVALSHWEDFPIGKTSTS